MSVLEIESVPRNNAPAKLASSIVIPGHLLVYGFTVYSSNGSAQYALMFDDVTLPQNGAAPITPLDLPSKTLRGVSWTPQGREFVSGFVLANSSTDTTLTIGAADCFFDLQYDLLD